MNDREMLEMAAKAIGFGLCADGKYTLCWTESDYPRGAKTNGALWNYIGHGETAQLWNPLTDDGDALRLAVKLCMFDYGGLKQFRLEETRLDPSRDDYTTMRRAIVRAAAEIGRTMTTESDR
jgi:hypothetical protein